MTEKEKIAYAKSFIDKLANGINPIDDSPVSESDVVNNVRIARCFFFVSDILRQAIESDGAFSVKKAQKQDFDITEERLNDFCYSSYPITISEIVKRINELIDAGVMKKLPFRQVMNWLISVNVIEETVENGKKVKIPTEKGNKLGISIELRNGYGGEYRVIVYDKKAQEFIIDNVNAIINFKQP